MARTVRDTALETRKARDKLSPGKRYWRNIRQGLAIGYYPARTGGGTWVVRWLMPDGRYTIQRIGIADNHQDANDIDVFSFAQACARVYAFAETEARRTIAPAGPYTVANAVADYLIWYRAHRKAYRDTELTCQVHILPALGAMPVADLTTPHIRQWHEQLAATPARIRRKAGAAIAYRAADPNDLDQSRARRATANRVLTTLKAALNLAFREGKVADDTAWRKVKPFARVDAPLVRHLNPDEIRRLLNACDPAMRALATGALQTGCRYAELTRLTAADVDLTHGLVHVRQTKSGKPRHVPLTEEGKAFFARLKVGKAPSDLLFVQESGRPWGESEQARPLKRAALAANVPDVSFHVLRHTYASLLAMAGTPLQVIAAALGHADTRVTERHYAHLLPSYVGDTIRAALPAFGVELDNVVPLAR